MDSFDKKRKGTGTREWSEHSVNLGTGCRHGCLYCYARTAAARFGKLDRKAKKFYTSIDMGKVCGPGCPGFERIIKRRGI